MELILSNMTTAFFNLIIFSSIPLLWWVIKRRKQKDIGFFQFVGLVKPHLHCNWWGLLVFAALYFLCYSGLLSQLFPSGGGTEITSSDAMADSVYVGIGVAAIVPSIIENFIANGFCEELLFRGFLQKRFAAKWGCLIGLILQAILFGFMHNVLYLIVGMPIEISEHLFIFIGTTAVGFMLGWLNEKIFCGSIFPSILLHGFENFQSSITVAFGSDGLFGVYLAYAVLVFGGICALVLANKQKQHNKI